MSKRIEETFEWRVNGRETAFVNARSYNSPLLSIGNKCSLALSAQELINLGKFLIETGEKINADNDFKKE
jgi:hypothetical protein